MRSCDSNVCDANSSMRFVPNVCVLQCKRVESSACGHGYPWLSRITQTHYMPTC